MIKGIGHAAFNVKDMEKTIAFYEETLGFKKAFDIPRPENGEPWIVYMYGGGGQFIELFYGATQDDAPKQGADSNWQCWTHDPDGIKIELMQLGEESPQMKFIKEMNF